MEKSYRETLGRARPRGYESRREKPLFVPERGLKALRSPEDSWTKVLGVGKGYREAKMTQANILIVGVGGAGTNAIRTLMEIGVKGACCVAINTDIRHLEGAFAHEKLLIGENITGGYGTGGYPSMGRMAADVDSDKIFETLGPKPDLVFIGAGMGGGTGTGAAPIVARIAREKHAIVIGVVTLPFHVEGEEKMKIALDGVRDLKKHAHVVILVSNERLRELTEGVPMADAFKAADYTLAVMVKGITEIVNKRAYINVDLADIKTVFLAGGGVSAVGIGESDDPKGRVEEAIGMALENQLLDYSLDGARGALVVVTGGPGITIGEAIKTVEIVKSKMARNGVVKLGVDIDEDMGNKVRVILVISGIKSPYFLPGEDVQRFRELTEEVTTNAWTKISSLESEVVKEIEVILGNRSVMRFY